MGGPGGERRPDSRGPRPTPTRTPVFGIAGSEEEGEKVGPIIGVHSLSTDTSIKIYEGRTQYNVWKFVFLEPEGANQGGAGGQDPDTPWGQVPTPVRPPPPPPQRTGTPQY